LLAANIHRRVGSGRDVGIIDFGGVGEGAVDGEIIGRLPNGLEFEAIARRRRIALVVVLSDIRVVDQNSFLCVQKPKNVGTTVSFPAG